uniref:ORF2 n=1 Tax=Torque teno Leptonychotes weddellii virus-1 TaxID=2012676 RepID=A0A1Z2RW84_9VIRU|nr:ORF2 [Torque teno Leptonychotes weddellii virus 1]
MCAALPTPGVPDLHHPDQYRKLEARWKKQLSRAHLDFCLCGNFLNHFRWPTGEGGTGDRAEADTAGTVADITGEEDMVGATGGGEGDLTDLELLQ